jgi:hypothetical protein
MEFDHSLPCWFELLFHLWRSPCSSIIDKDAREEMPRETSRRLFRLLTSACSAALR